MNRKVCIMYCKFCNNHLNKYYIKNLYTLYYKGFHLILQIFFNKFKFLNFLQYLYLYMHHQFCIVLNYQIFYFPLI